MHIICPKLRSPPSKEQMTKKNSTVTAIMRSILQSVHICFRFLFIRQVWWSLILTFDIYRILQDLDVLHIQMMAAQRLLPSLDEYTSLIMNTSNYFHNDNEVVPIPPSFIDTPSRLHFEQHRELFVNYLAIGIL